AVIAAFVILGGSPGSHTSGTTSLSGGPARPQAPAASIGAPPVERTHVDYSPAELNALAAQSASNIGGGAPVPPSPATAGGTKEGVDNPETYVACVAAAAGASPGDVVSVEVARFRGMPAWIGTLVVGG